MAVLPSAGSARNHFETTKRTTEIKSATRNVSANAERKIKVTKNLTVKEKREEIMKGEG
jgi:hypothetical protein